MRSTLMSRNVVVCLDGTGNEVKARGASNVLKIVELLDLRDPAAQIVYYDPGVGTFAAPSAWTAAARAVSRLGGLALGRGLRQNLGEAYTFLMNTWRPGDRVFVFGFSRGAYTARALCGMLYRVGLLRPGSENLVPYAVRVYARRPGKDSNLRRAEGWARMDRFAEALSVRPQPGSDSLAFPIEFLGLFDTVKATRFLGRDIRWPYTNKLPNVRVARHAVSSDEKRRPYREVLIPTPPPGGKPVVTETWFAGVHSDIGGGFDTHPEAGRITMRWMMEGAIAAGLLVRERRLANRYTLSEADGTAPINEMGWIWAFAGTRRRTIPPGAQVHGSVRTRRAAHPDYGRTLAGEPVWDDGAWPFGRQPSDPAVGARSHVERRSGAGE
jgi:uncharacterized protein (DUF2235 family)